MKMHWSLCYIHFFTLLLRYINILGLHQSDKVKMTTRKIDGWTLWSIPFLWKINIWFHEWGLDKPFWHMKCYSNINNEIQYTLVCVCSFQRTLMQFGPFNKILSLCSLFLGKRTWWIKNSKFSHAERIGALKKRYVDMIFFSHSAMNKTWYTHHLKHILH